MISAWFPGDGLLYSEQHNGARAQRPGLNYAMPNIEHLTGDRFQQQKQTP